MFRKILCGAMCGLFGFLSAGEQGSQTFLVVRPPFQSGSAEYQSMFWVPRSEDNSFLEIAPFGGATTNDDYFVGYFLPYTRTILLTAEDSSSEAKRKDLAAINFNIKTNNQKFSSDSLFKASQSIAGVAFIWRHIIAHDFYIELIAPVEQVTRRITIKETIFNDGGGVASGTGLDDSPYVGSLTDAFKQDTWKYGRIFSGCDMKKAGVADVELKLGVCTYPMDNIYIFAYTGMVFPTGNKPTAEYVFEPMIGNDHHYGILTGSSCTLEFWKYKAHALQWGFSLNTRFLLHNYQIRSFDLTDKEFGRYLESYADAADAEYAFNNSFSNTGTAGINVYTKKVKVSPGVSTLASTGLTYTYKGVDVEVGYTLFARQHENVQIAWNPNPAVKDVSGDGKTNTARTIRRDYPGDSITFANYDPLVVRDLDLASAAAPATISHTFTVGAGYTVYDNDKIALFMGLGGSYEYEPATAAFNRWMMWGKIGFYY